MFTTFAKRALVVGAAMTAMVLAASGQAQAANAYLILSDRDGRQLGTMTHYDAETDRFTVCDTQSEGRNIIGKLYAEGGDTPLLTITDGSDAGCDSKTYNLRAGRTYEMLVYLSGEWEFWRTMEITE
ncbi:hypothetical protein [Glycomyces terrestris]|uniref:Uncharacterized protein n=1 Tax=Glycomyces terrestris TaxID=2493553 RepID=A0A426V3F3_9ACTN|nr:hypothetical protein [Glycomyces terrestris]RRS01370.1 hypothetical protein EIW28_00925 [Glycomyces terrestris]